MVTLWMVIGTLFSKRSRLGLKLFNEVGGNPHIESSPRLEEVRRLLDAGADVNYNDGWESVLSKAGRAPWCDPSVVKLLLERGANVNGTQGKYLIPPLVRAAHQSDDERIRLLVDAGADLNVVFGWRTALIELTPWASPELMEYLLKRGADPNVGNSYGKPLHWVAWWGRADLVDLYIRYGANVSATDKDGHTPLQIASNQGPSGRWTGGSAERFEEIIRLLCEAGAEG